MKITLHDRTESTVEIYYTKAQQPAIRRTLPQKTQTLNETLADFAKTQLPDASSYGRTIAVDGCYVGDVSCYSIDLHDTPNAMLSYCVFEPDLWGKGVATQAVGLFLAEAAERYGLRSIGAFTYAQNAASIRVLEKNGFMLVEKFAENGILSRYYQRSLQEK